jgi:hypothetical protein
VDAVAHWFRPRPKLTFYLPLNVDSTLLSDYARAEGGGGLTVVNAFNRLRANRFPVEARTLYLSLIVHAAEAEAGSSHNLEVLFLNARREAIGPEIKVSFKLPPGPAVAGIPLRTALVLSLNGWTFPEAGPYAFEVYIDGTYASSAVVHAALVP